MTKENTMQKKSQLAKLLATENIEVQENAVQTASFDVVNRILTIPVFKEEQKSKHVYDMLVGHEVSHALHTPSESWKDMANRTKEFKSFVNVIEDARIDKLIQKKYPGLKDDYLKGFDKMLKDNFFGTKGKDIKNDYALIDKINLYYKSSKRLDFNFTPKEKILVNAVDKCKTFDDVLKLSEEILGYCKKELEKKQQLQKVYKPDQLGDKKSDSDTDSNDSDKSTDQKLDEWLEKKSESDDSDESAKKKESNQTGGNGAGSPDNTPTELRALTADNYETSVKGITDNEAHTRCYAELPGVDLKKLIIPYQKFIRDIMVYDKQHHNTDYDKQQINKAKVRTQKFMKESSNVVNFLVKEFEMKKNAKLYARASQDKTGIIDPLKLHSYKFAEDIFKKITTIPNQKNHGMILLLDWSGSMQKHILPTVEQLLNLTLFCKKINIPFSVYAFMNNHRDSKDEYSKSGFKVNSKSVLPDATTKLVQLFSHKQSKIDYMRCATLLHRAAMYFGDYYGWRTRSFDDDQSVPSISGDYFLSSTPLNESLIAMDHIVKKFKKDYNTEKLSLVTLTDGASNSMNRHGNGDLYLKLNGRYVEAGSYYMEKKDFTSVMLRYLKKKYDLQTIGFYLVSKYRELQYQLRVPYNKEMLARKMFTKDKFIADYDTAYDVYFYVNSGTRVANKVFESDSTDKRSLKKMFMSGMKNRINSRVLLKNFIKRIA